MADPHIQAELDILDKVTVCIYRLGFVVATCALLLLSWYPQYALLILLVGATMCASSLHIYLKHFRLLFQFATWIGLLCMILGVPALALGGVLLTLGGLCFKEYFCFRVPLLNLQPFFFALLWICWVQDLHLGVQILSIFTGLLTLMLAIQKFKMPLHFDIGDKSKYQI